MKRLYLALLALIAICPLWAQLVTSIPTILQENSQGVVLTYHADSPLGDRGLANLPQSTDVYAHIGVITSKSTSSSDWKYTVTPWPNTGNQQTANTGKNRLTYLSPNTYELEIGNLHDYFGVPASETVKQVAIVFRTADGSRTGRGAAGADIFVNVLPDGFAMVFDCDRSDLVLDEPTEITFTAETSLPAALQLDVNGTPFANIADATKLQASYTFATQGDYTVTAKATYDGKSYTKKILVSYPKSSPQRDYPGGVPQMGCVKNDDGTVTFCLAAPQKKSVVLVGSWDDYEVLQKNLMYYQDYKGNRYFWTTVSGLADDQWYPYFFVVDDKYRVGDPYTHMVLDCYSDNSLRTSVWRDRPKYPYDKFSNVMMGCYRGDIDDYTFSDFTIPDHDNLVIYEMLLRDFTSPVNGLANGWGTVRLAIDKIPYIKAMGFNAVELMPIMEFNGNNSWGYNTNFYMAPDKAYGSPTDYKDFVEACHQNGIAVILDIVFNQSDGLHPWYQMYPIDSNPFYNKTAPHQWSVLNDWNQGNDLVQQQWTDALKYWMTAYNVDGFRFDLVKGLGDNDSYANGTESYNASRVNRMKRLHGVITSVKPDGIHINEDLAGAQEEKELGNDGQLQWANINEASRNFAQGSGTMNFMRFMSSSDGGRPWGSTVSYAESHDEQRMAFQAESYGTGDIKTDAAKRFRRLGTVAAQMLLIPGPKMVWQFGELGDNQNAKQNPNGSGGNNTDAKIVDWRWLDDPDRHALMETSSKIINARMDNPELFSRDATYMQRNLVSSTNGRTIRLNSGDKEIIGFFNPAVSGSMAITVESQQITPSSYTLIAASPDFAPVLGGTGNSLSVDVPAGCFAVYASSSVAGVEDVVGGTTVTVSGGNGCINISGDYTNAAAYDLSGRLMPSLSVPAGLYIVVVDGTATKVLVK